jgi:serine/threonine protein kinase
VTERTPGAPFGEPVTPEAGRVPGLPRYRGLLGDGYAVVEVHRGGMGEVLICESEDDPEHRIALKSFQKRLFFDATSRSAFIREAAIWTRLTGVPHVMPALGLEYLDDRPFVRMPAIGQTVRQVVASERLASDDAVAVAAQIAIGMAAAATRVDGLVHGDLKPENLFLAPAGLLISDFGLARASGDHALHLSSTWAYRAPECWTDPRAASQASDVYAFGAIVCELFFGALPFMEQEEEAWSRAHRERAPELPSSPAGGGLDQDVGTLATRCLAKDPDDRPADFQTVKRELIDAVHRSDPIQALMLFHGSAVFAQESASWREDSTLLRVQTLVQLGEHETALEELEALPESALTDEVRVEHGNVLSLTHRDEEAVSIFRGLLARALDEEVRTRCLLLLGLSLNRLGSYDEAIEVYDDLLNIVPDERVVEVMVNLATVLLAKGEPREVLWRLKPLATAHPESPELWGNIALAHRDLGELEDSVTAFRRAIAAAPYRGDLQVQLAAVLLDDLGDVGMALTTLDLAGSQGETTEDWYVRIRACYQLLGDERGDAELRAVAERDLPAERVRQLDVHIAELVSRVRGISPPAGDQQP